ncbi:hypothetical protein WEN_02290 [Mycoplasma wenyonii str. Massachusetts]|uniref:Uncharacterized protein n=1 Tax=Mycoplasma wenyonii (strain Massachusetts) TaxID=1197325 RepID=I6ZJ86_MYCWM|nr:hypothetical protein [Mycoplasma wenyonii]AFN65245.1 hypothetical protein WEN_02290 [Mycoplasma wenyonii str. Massachusetts]
MTTVVKALLGGAVVAVPASSVTMYVFRESIFNSLSGAAKELEKRCYVIPTEQSSTPAQLLICKGQEALTSGENSEYFLYNKDENKQHIKVTEIKKKESNLEVTLENDEPQEKVTLSINSEDWTEINTELNLKDACNLLNYQESDGGTKWQCNFGSSGDPKEIKLNSFAG